MTPDTHRHTAAVSRQEAAARRLTQPEFAAVPNHTGAPDMTTELADELHRQAILLDASEPAGLAVFGEWVLNNLPAILSALRSEGRMREVLIQAEGALGYVCQFGHKAFDANDSRRTTRNPVEAVTPTTPDLSELIRRLEEATGPEPELARKLAAALFGTGFTIPQVLLCRAALSDGIDAVGAALALVAETLPGATVWAVKLADGSGESSILHNGSTAVCDEAATPALAVLIALMRALEARDDH